MDPTTIKGKVMDTEEGLRFEALGSALTVKLTGHDTQGAFALVERITPPGLGTPPHIHAEEDETLYILAGEIDLQVAGTIARIGAGTAVFLPRDVPHGFTVVGDAPCRALIAITPAGLENYFREVDRLLDDGRPDWPQIASLSAEYGIRFLGLTFPEPSAAPS